MTRSEGTTLIALLTIIATSVAGLAAAVTLGVRDEDSPALLTSGPSEETQVAEVLAETPSPVAKEAEEAGRYLRGTALNTIHDTPTPDAPDTWGRGADQFEHFRSWEGELTVWQGYQPQLILGPEGNWFPAGQPGCGTGVHLVTFEGGDGVVLKAQLRDGVGTLTGESEASSSPEGWMLADDCHLPYIQLVDLPDGPVSAEVSYTVHEYQRTSR